ncbi:2483_t:CDS:2 [Acaulospora morrowiae]|uniref:2483_t:CDS:1 n=1 Tax=Acaulospora morrowiae TaxID=94023 RepID=A0A9N9F9U3_9GLOM|nr:2483_t:CDS:2 [Acaulospora morrowiae]
MNERTFSNSDLVTSITFIGASDAKIVFKEFVTLWWRSLSSCDNWSFLSLEFANKRRRIVRKEIRIKLFLETILWFEPIETQQKRDFLWTRSEVVFTQALWTSCYSLVDESPRDVIERPDRISLFMQALWTSSYSLIDESFRDGFESPKSLPALSLIYMHMLYVGGMDVTLDNKIFSWCESNVSGTSVLSNMMSERFILTSPPERMEGENIGIQQMKVN